DKSKGQDARCTVISMGLLTPEELERAYQTALAALLAERHPDGYWVGELSTSALSTATAISALALVQKHTGTSEHQRLIQGGLAWLAAHQNTDGGWGDTIKSFSNISTTMLCRAAFCFGMRNAECGMRNEGPCSNPQSTIRHPQSADSAFRNPHSAIERAENW